MTFEEHVLHALDSLPDDIARGLENVAVVVEEHHPDEPTLLGLFEQPVHLPAKITIYQRPLEAAFGYDPERLEHEIRVTVLHEVAHYFGIGEERLRELGYH